MAHDFSWVTRRQYVAGTFTEFRGPRKEEKGGTIIASAGSPFAFNPARLLRPRGLPPRPPRPPHEPSIPGSVEANHRSLPNLVGAGRRHCQASLWPRPTPINCTNGKSTVRSSQPKMMYRRYRGTYTRGLAVLRLDLAPSLGEGTRRHVEGVASDDSWLATVLPSPRESVDASYTGNLLPAVRRFDSLPQDVTLVGSGSMLRE
ncbi:hypothetical protein KM043_005165 [Ampulex compressa]|nr:hypothetical protein KM043_005165 [Ampulex compressa]